MRRCDCNQRISDVRRQFEREQKCCKHGDKQDESGDPGVLKELGTKVVEVEDESDRAGALPVEQDASEEGEGFTVKVSAVGAQCRKLK